MKDSLAPGFVEIGPPDIRQGQYVGTDLEDWWCWDEHCDCHRVTVTRVYFNQIASINCCWFVRIWEGTFFTDGEGAEERKQELIQGLHDVNIRYPGERWRNATVPAHPENYRVDHSQDVELRRLAAEQGQESIDRQRTVGVDAVEAHRRFAEEYPAGVP